MTETNRIEYKRQLNDTLEKGVVAFLNSYEGGLIYIGIEDSGEVVGVSDVDAVQLKIKDRIKSNITPSTMGLFDVLVEERAGKSIVKITVASGSEKPYFLKKMSMTPKGCFLRVGSAAEPMEQSMIDDMFASRVRNSIGNIASRKQSPTFEQLKIYYQSTSFDLGPQFAANLELLTKDGEYNYAAYLLSDNNGCSIKVGKYAGLDRVDLLENEEYGYCSLVKATKAVLEKLKVENRTFTQITAAERLERKMLEPVAIREAIINAIIHNDFSNEVPPKFELFADRFEITSAGGLPPGFTKAQFFMGYSVPRNKELMRVFKDLEMVEHMGSGVPRILKAYPQTIYQFSQHFTRLVFPYAEGFTESLQSTANISGTATIKINARATPQATPQVTPQVTPQATMHGELSENAEKTLKFCKKPRSRDEIQDHLGLKDREYFRKEILIPLIEQGKLQLTIPDKPTSPLQKYVKPGK